MKTPFILLWLFCAKASLGQDWVRVEKYEAEYAGDNSLTRSLRSVSGPDVEDLNAGDSDDAEVVFDEDGRPRDKRTLGLIVRGLASALGYTLTPIQVASLPNPSPPPPPAPPAPPAVPPKAPAPPARPPAPAPPARPPAAAPPAKRPAPAPPAPPPQPTQRETIRLTGLLNFGPNANSNLPAQLGQYEQIFHGSAVPQPPAPRAPPAPAPAPAPAAKPTLAKIPSPIVPNLVPLVPPSRPPTSGPKPGAPMKQEVETVYRNSENLEKYNVENKEIVGDQNPYLDSPGRIYASHNAQVQNPNWQQGYNDRLKELERRQKEYADRLKHHEDRLVKQQQDHENTDERFSNREKEIAQRDEAHAARLRGREREGDSQENEEGSKTEAEDSRAEYEEGDKTSGGHGRPQSSDSEEENQGYELERERAPKEYSEYDEEPKKYSDYEDYPQKHASYESEDDEKLPISGDKENDKSEEVRNSYGESLEDRGKIDENIADYFGKFKDSKTGLYVPEKIQNAENYKKYKEPWWKGNQEEFDGRIEGLRQEYALPAPESKYEEYELEETPEDGSKSEEPEAANKAEETTPRSNNAQQIPDYSEAFGGYEPYVQQLEPKRNQEILPPSTDILDNSRSELKQDSNDESERESQKSEEDKEIPLYRFDFKSFLPYYSPIKYIYGPDDAEPGLPRIQSYNQHSGAQEAAEPTEKAPVERAEPSEDLRPKIGLPEKLTMKSLHDGESKELHAWPAPFDHVFDSTEQTNVAELPNRIEDQPGTGVPVGGTADPYNEGPQATPIGYLVPEYDAEFRNDHGVNLEQREPESFHAHPVETQRLQEGPESYGFLDRFRSSSHLEDTPRQTQGPQGPATGYNFREGPGKIQQPESQNHRYTSSDDRYPRIQASATPATDERTHHESRRTYQPVEAQYRERTADEEAPTLQKADFRNRGPDFGQHYTPSEPRPSGRRFDGTEENRELQQDEQGPSSPQEEDKSSLKFEDPKSAHDFFGFSQNDYDYENNKKIEKSQEIKEPQSSTGADEVLDLLVVSEPTPYQYDERLTEFTDEPESDTEKVKVKEYRNKVATVTISERKQLSPEGPIQLIGYTHQF